jgi:hypothetical protein
VKVRWNFVTLFATLNDERKKSKEKYEIRKENRKYFQAITLSMKINRETFFFSASFLKLFIDIKKVHSFNGKFFDDFGLSKNSFWVHYKSDDFASHRIPSKKLKFTEMERQKREISSEVSTVFLKRLVVMRQEKKNTKISTEKNEIEFKLST